jgi:hypothetical protein
MEKLYWTAGMFAVVLGCVALAAATKSVVPVFLAWLPLLALVWVLNRPGASDASWADQAAGETGTRDTPDTDEA